MAILASVLIQPHLERGKKVDHSAFMLEPAHKVRARNLAQIKSFMEASANQGSRPKPVKPKRRR